MPKIKLSFFDAENKSFSFQKQSGEQSSLCFLRRLGLCGVAEEI